MVPGDAQREVIQTLERGLLKEEAEAACRDMESTGISGDNKDDWSPEITRKEEFELGG